MQRTISIPRNLSAVNKLIREKPQFDQTTDPSNPPVEASVSPPPTGLNEPFDLPKVQDCIDDIISAYREKGDNIEVALLKQPYEVSGQEITFILSGELQKDMFAKLSPELTGLLRKSLRNHQIMVTYEIREEPENTAKKLYTSSDKLTYLMEKSPILKEFKERLGLETDF